MPGFPTVPLAPGVPLVPRNPLALNQPLPLLSADVSSSFGRTRYPQWGIFKNGRPAVVADSVLSMGYRQDWGLLDYPVEKGAFQTYNKVNSPFEIRVRFSAGGDEGNRAALLNSVQAVSDSLDLFDVVTPEKVYQSVNVFHYDFNRRHNDGVGLIKVDVWCLEIRVTAVAAFSQTKKPDGADPVSGGTVQTTPPTKDQKASITQRVAAGKS